MSGKTTRNVAQIVDEAQVKVSRDLDVKGGEFELDVYGEDNKYSVVNMLPGKMKELAKMMPVDLKGMTQDELRDLVEPDSLLTQLRLRFWYVYDEAAFSGKPIRISTVAKGVCDSEVFRKTILNPEKLAFILSPVVNYEVQVQDFLETSLYKMRKGLDNIEVRDSKDLLAVLKVYDVFDKRVHGEYKQEKKVVIEQTTGPAKKTSAELSHIKKDLLIGKE